MGKYICYFPIYFFIGKIKNIIRYIDEYIDVVATTFIFIIYKYMLIYDNDY